MPCIPDTICGADVDSLFAYPTVKIVRIRDSRLGLFKVFLIFLITLYIGLIQLWKDSGYLATEKVSGITRFTLQQPTVDDCSPTNSDCMNDYDSLESIPYCSQSSLPWGGGAVRSSFWEGLRGGRKVLQGLGGEGQA